MQKKSQNRNQEPELTKEDDLKPEEVSRPLKMMRKKSKVSQKKKMMRRRWRRRRIMTSASLLGKHGSLQGRVLKELRWFLLRIVKKKKIRRPVKGIV